MISSRPLDFPAFLDPVRTDPATRRQMFAVLLGHLAAVFQDAPQPSVGNPVRHLSAFSLPFNEAAPAQARQVIRHLALTHPECVDEL